MHFPESSGKRKSLWNKKQHAYWEKKSTNEKKAGRLFTKYGKVLNSISSESSK